MGFVVQIPRPRALSNRGDALPLRCSTFALRKARDLKKPRKVR
jgi:hypothetical protein